MKTKKIQVTISFAVVALTLILSLIGYTFIDKSAAWFADNDRTDAGGLVVNVENGSNISATITFHHILGQNGTTFYFDKTSGNSIMPKYDILNGTERHILLRVELEEVADISLTAVTEATYFMDGETHPLIGSVTGKGEDYNNSISSIVTIAPVDVALASYENSDTYSLTLPTETKAFANQNADTGDMEITETLSIISGSKKEFFVIVSYSDYNISRIYSENIGNSVIQGGSDEEHEVVFFADFYFELTLGGGAS